MKLRKFFGLTSRSVLEQVRAELGADAVIVANRPSADGIEITAMAGDAMETILQRETPVPSRPRSAAVEDPEREAAFSIGLPPRVQESRKDAPEPVATVQREAVAATEAPLAAASPAKKAEPRADDPGIPTLDTVYDTLTDRVSREIAGMRAFIEEQVGQLAWSDALRRSPTRARLARTMLAAGYSYGLAREVSQRLPADLSSGQAQEWLAAVLGRNLRSNPVEAEIVNRGGVYALVGPTGVGKTTTTAKLAARCAVRYGAGKLALLTTDSYRVGAHDQLRIYARILGVPVHTVTDQQDLRQALDSMRGKHLVLIDTVGMSQRDERVREQSLLLSQPEVRRLLLLNASAQAETLEEVVAAYRRDPNGNGTVELAGAILTKLDEAAQLGPVLDVVIRHHLLLHYTSAGQRVPEDLHDPHPNYLVHRSLRPRVKTDAFTLDEDAFALIGGAVAGAAHVA